MIFLLLMASTGTSNVTLATKKIAPASRSMHSEDRSFGRRESPLFGSGLVRLVDLFTVLSISVRSRRLCLHYVLTGCFQCTRVFVTF
jgi:hypothetical protein